MENNTNTIWTTPFKIAFGWIAATSIVGLIYTVINVICK